MAELDKYIANLAEEFSRLSYVEMENASGAEKLLYLYAYYHYFNADSSAIPDLLQGVLLTNDAFDQIAGVFIDQDSDFEDVDVILVHFSENNSFDFSTYFKVFQDVETILCDLVIEKKRDICRDALKAAFSDSDHKFSSTRPLKIRLVTNCNPKTANAKRSITKALNDFKPAHDFVTYSIVFGLDIEYEVLEIENPKEYVSEAIVKVDLPNNFVRFGAEKSIIANVSAKSIKELYELYGYRGLFAQNLRYYVKAAKIDDRIIESIQEQPDNFWYYNNGIIIICSDYQNYGPGLRLVNFSIINGGQTTKLIGETDFSTDFFVPCKIIKAKYGTEEENIEFISKVAEASNTQKPIKDKDLIANRVEQRLLKRQLAAAGVYCQIKRGEKVNKKLYPEAWQNTTNEELGQFLLSFVYQLPGSARGAKATICGNPERYSLLFGKTYNSDLLCDLLRIKQYYKLWMAYTKKNDDGEDPYKMGLVNNGMFFMTSIIGAVAKMYFHPATIDGVRNAVLIDGKMEAISQHDIDHAIFCGMDDPKKVFFALFEYCYSMFFLPGYEYFKDFKPGANNFSNFTKVNSNYSHYIFRQISTLFQNGIQPKDREYLDSVFYSATEDDLARDSVLLKQYVNLIAGGDDVPSVLPDSVVATISDKLTEYRTKTYKAHRIKAYEVFKNASRDKIAKFAPTTIEELEGLHCLDQAQIDLYGEEIIEVIKTVLQQAGASKQASLFE